ncbi:hypothetical protein ONZ45_g7076 [Pleurotus djamor]|nr:hypothetical protein ONZ45_g7076 [Pleurotus djamor]
MDLRFNHGTDIYAVRACCNQDATDLVAIGGEHSVQVLRVTDTTCEAIATFHIGSRITTLAWAANTISPGVGDDWNLHEYGSQTPSLIQDIFKLRDRVFFRGRCIFAFCYLSALLDCPSDDRMLMIWDLFPPAQIFQAASSDRETSLSPPPRQQPTAYVIPFAHPLTSVCSHPVSSKELIAADCRGSIFLTDWRSEADEKDQSSLRHSCIMELTEPSTLANTISGTSNQWTGSVGWRKDTPDIIGGAYGSKFHIWDLTTLQGGKPRVSGSTFAEGAHRFRWCHTYPEYFAVSSQSPTKGAIIHMHNVTYVHAQPTVFNILPRPHFVRDFDFMASPGIPRLAVALGTELVSFPIGIDP